MLLLAPTRKRFNHCFLCSDWMIPRKKPFSVTLLLMPAIVVAQQKRKQSELTVNYNLVTFTDPYLPKLSLAFDVTKAAVVVALYWVKGISLDSYLFEESAASLQHTLGRSLRVCPPRLCSRPLLPLLAFTNNMRS
jgi:hypothetical protein